MPSIPWTDERAIVQMCRRRARRRGLEFLKAYGQTCYFLVDLANRADTARVFYSLAEVAAALTDEAGPAG